MSVILGVNVTKSYLYYAVVDVENDTFTVRYTERLAYTFDEPSQTLQSLNAVLDSVAGDAEDGLEVAICSCSAGTMASGVDTIKCEGLVDLVCDQRGLKSDGYHPTGFRHLFDSKDSKWQAQAKERFNADGAIKYFGSGVDGAVVAAFKRFRNKLSGKV